MEADEGELVLSSNAMRKLFDKVLDDIIGEVTDFVCGLEDPCSHVVLVGGFGESKYFLKQLRTALSGFNCSVTSPSVPSQAVLAGSFSGLRAAPAACGSLSRVRQLLHACFGSHA